MGLTILPSGVTLWPKEWDRESTYLATFSPLVGMIGQFISTQMVKHRGFFNVCVCFIALASEGTDVRALFELTMLDQSGKVKHKVHSHFDRALESGPYTLKYRGSMWGYKRFF